MKERESACSQFLVFLLAVAIAVVLFGIYLFELPAVQVGEKEGGGGEGGGSADGAGGKECQFLAGNAHVEATADFCFSLKLRAKQAAH